MPLQCPHYRRRLLASVRSALSASVGTCFDVTSNYKQLGNRSGWSDSIILNYLTIATELPPSFGTRGMKLSKQVYEISNLLEISSDEYH